MAFPDSDLTVKILVYLGADPTADSGTWPAATDMSSRLLDGSVRITLGRTAGQASLTSGSCVFDLDDTDGALTPLMATSAYYGTWDLGVPVAVNVDGVGASPPYGRFRGYVADITQTIVPGVGDVNISIVRVTLGGKARQLTQGKVEKSAMRRYYDKVSPQPVAYWPLESGDQRGALSFPSPIAGVADLAIAQATFFGVTRPFSAAGGVTPGPVGAVSATDTSAGGYVVGAVNSPSNATTARGEVSFLADGFENTIVDMIQLRNPTVASDGRDSRINAVAQNFGGTWQVGVDWTGPGGNVQDYASDPIALQDNQWHHVQLDIASAGGGANTSYTLRIDGVVIRTGTATGFPWVPPNVVWSNPLATDIDRMAHFAVWSGTSLPSTGDSDSAYMGDAGEAAHTRFNRICTEDGLPHSTTATSSTAVGPQPVGDAVAILQDLETADHGVLYELANAWGFGYLAASQRANLSAAMTIDLSTYRTSDDGGSVLTPVRNDAKVRNQWTVSTPDGRAATVADTDHQSKKGRYDDSGDANISTTTDLINEASWRVHEGTYDGPRYRTMPIDLGSNTASPSNLLTPWLTTELGNRIDRTNNPTPEHPYDAATFVLQGYAETLGRRSWMVDAVAEPYEPWRVQQLTANPPANNTLDGWLDTTSLTLRTTVNATATSWSVNISPVMVTAAADYPCRAFCEGEVITITACSGASSPQTWTVTRSVNGVSKSHTAGAVITLADAIILSL